MKKNWKLFLWAIERLKFDGDECKKCLRNGVLLLLMNLSGITSMDVDERINSYNDQ